MEKQQLKNLLSEMKIKWKVHPPKGTKEYFEYRRDISKYNLMVKEVEKIEAGIEITATDLTDDQMAELLK